MSQLRTEKPSRPEGKRAGSGSSNLVNAVLQFAPLWGAVACVLFYAILPVFPFQRELLIRYCTSHPLEYITMGLFFLGMATLILRRIELAREEHGLRRYSEILTEVAGKALTAAPENAAALLEVAHKTKSLLVETIAGRRITEGTQYVSECESPERLDEHLRHIADLEADRAIQKFGFIHTISWAVPILGFLGTVMGITLAIANVTPDQLDQSLPEVTGGLAVAFDTTALSLSLSLVLVFATFLVRRKQDEILADVEQKIDHRLCFLLKRGFHGSISQNHAEVSGQLVDVSARIVSDAAAVWKENLQQLDLMFAETLRGEQSRMASSLRESLANSLRQHEAELAQLRTHERERHELVAAHMAQALASWEQSMLRVSATFGEQTHELRRQTELVLNVIDKQQQLLDVEQQIHESLNTHQIVSTLDETLNSLHAAIQLLNVRVTTAQRAA